MNRERRAKIKAQINRINEIAASLQDIMDEEQDYFDNMPENLQGSIRGDAAEEAISTLDDAVSALEDVTSSLEELL